MSRINYAAKHEYESMANYKILQSVFQRNRIDKPIPVDRLVRCKMQDNLEFLQWLKKFWDTNYAGDGYDADARRAAAPSRAGSAAGGAARPRPSVAGRTGSASRQSTVSRQGTVPPVPRQSNAPRPSVAGRPAAGSASAQRAAPTSNPAARRMSTVRGGPARGPSASAISNETINQLTTEIDEMKVSVDSLERERDFYFGKLRDVEVLVQERLADLARALDEAGGEDKSGAAETETLKQIQGVLYQTEEGFELPDVADEVRTTLLTQAEPLDETETF